MPSNAVSKKAYFQPTLRKLAFEQASLFLTGYAWIGNQDAQELLILMFPEPGGQECENTVSMTADPGLQVTPVQR